MNDLTEIINNEKAIIASENEAQTIYDIATEQLRDKMFSGESDISDIAKQVVDVKATADAVEKYSEKYAEAKHKELSEEGKGKVRRAKNKTDEQVNASNELFYKRFRPILEFDHSNITGRVRTTEDNAESKSYSKTLMIATLVFATLPWLIMAFICCIFKGSASVIDMVNGFSKEARRLIISLLLVAAVALVIYVALRMIELYTGIKLLPKEVFIYGN